MELYREFMEDIATEIDRENKIINDLLALIKMDGTAFTLNISQVDINLLVELIMRRLRPIAIKRDIELVYESIRPVMAAVDEVKITQVITNLIENAIKYNKEHGWVKVTVDADHQFLPWRWRIPESVFRRIPSNIFMNVFIGWINLIPEKSKGQALDCRLLGALS